MNPHSTAKFLVERVVDAVSKGKQGASRSGLQSAMAHERWKCALQSRAEPCGVLRPAGPVDESQAVPGFRSKEGGDPHASCLA